MNDKITDRQLGFLIRLGVPYHVIRNWSKAKASEYLTNRLSPNRATRAQIDALHHYLVPRWLTASWSEAEAAARIELCRDPAYR
jgi:hypothetical protein